ncbi:MAG: YhbY family RNA-binding protein, partial [Candidatus Asgardarchaeia archaeon]
MSSEEYHIVRVGKGGLTDNVVKEIMRQLKEKKIIKVKFMKSIVSNKKQFNEIVDNLLKKLPNA